METSAKNINPLLNLAQLGWVFKNINSALKFFTDTLGIKNFSGVVSIRARDYEGTYYGKPSNAESLVSMAYSGGTFIELIEPVSGNSIFQDYLNENPSGGLHHIAYSIPLADFNSVISKFEKNGYQMASSFNTPIAKIEMFDTRKETGLFTEIMGITREGETAIEKMKDGLWESNS